MGGGGVSQSLTPWIPHLWPAWPPAYSTGMQMTWPSSGQPRPKSSRSRVSSPLLPITPAPILYHIYYYIISSSRKCSCIASSELVASVRLPGWSRGYSNSLTLVEIRTPLASLCSTMSTSSGSGLSSSCTLSAFKIWPTSLQADGNHQQGRRRSPRLPLCSWLHLIGVIPPPSKPVHPWNHCQRYILPGLSAWWYCPLERWSSLSFYVRGQSYCFSTAVVLLPRNKIISFFTLKFI